MPISSCCPRAAAVASSPACPPGRPARRAACAGRARWPPAASCAGARTPSAPSCPAPRPRSGCARARSPAARRRCRAAGAARARRQRGIVGLDRQHAAHAHRRLQRQVEKAPPAACRCHARPARRVESPLRHADVDAAGVGAGHRLAGGRRRPPPAARRARELGCQEARADLGHLLGAAARRKVARHLVERAHARPRAAWPRGLEFSPAVIWPMTRATTSITANVKRYCASLHGEREARRHEEEVERRHGEERRQHRRPAAEAHRHDDHGQQEHHHDVGELEHSMQRRGQQRHARADRERPERTRPAPRRASALAFRARPAQRGARARAAGIAIWITSRSAASCADALGQRARHGQRRAVSRPSTIARQVVLARVPHDGRRPVRSASVAVMAPSSCASLSTRMMRLPPPRGRRCSARRLHVDRVPRSRRAAPPCGRRCAPIFSPCGVGADAREQRLARLPHRPHRPVRR